MLACMRACVHACARTGKALQEKGKAQLADRPLKQGRVGQRQGRGGGSSSASKARRQRGAGGEGRTDSHAKGHCCHYHLRGWHSNSGYR